MKHRPHFATASDFFLSACLALALSGCSKSDEPAPAPVAVVTNAPPKKPVEKKDETPVEFKAQWPVGKRLVVRVQNDSDIKLTLPNSPTPMTNEIHQTAEHALSVVRVREGGGHDLEVEMLAQKMDIKAGGKPGLNFDTRNEAKSDRANLAQQSFRKIVGAKVKYQTGLDGKVTKIEGAPLLISKLTTGVPLQQQSMFRQMFTDDNLKEMVDIHRGLPDHPVKAGETWETRRDIAGAAGVTLIATITNTFKGWEDHDKRKCALIIVSGVVTNKPGPNAFGATVTMESSAYSGKIWFDPESGLITESQTDLDIAVKTSSPATPNQSMGTVAKQKSNTKLVEITDASGTPAGGMKTGDMNGADMNGAPSPAPGTKPTSPK